MKSKILLSGISFLSGVILTAVILYFTTKQPATNEFLGEKESALAEKSKVLFSTQETEKYYFPTHNNFLIMDRTNAEVAESFIVQIAPYKNTHRHVHNDTEQVFYVLSGKGRLDLERDGKMENYNLEPTNFVHVPRNLYHQIFCTGADSLNYLAIDCFPHGSNPLEPTWNDHVIAMCKLMGWDFSKVRIKP
jgi:quercetin dioxygenase-like cupin family protein